MTIKTPNNQDKVKEWEKEFDKLYTDRVEILPAYVHKGIRMLFKDQKIFIRKALKQANQEGREEIVQEIKRHMPRIIWESEGKVVTPDPDDSGAYLVNLMDEYLDQLLAKLSNTKTK